MVKPSVTNMADGSVMLRIVEPVGEARVLQGLCLLLGWMSQ